MVYERYIKELNNCGTDKKLCNETKGKDRG